ncbi:hypothetical protein Shewana3_1272 [Shewanella sp. ANA-3]|nr:hypothetical protein Shewana3_1272 [Shewanella sp. ANA-3]
MPGTGGASRNLATSGDHGLRKVAHVRADLGESPVWDARKGLLYFVDISGGKILVLTPQARVEAIYLSRRAPVP